MSDGHPRAAVVVLAAGAGARLGHDVNKVLLPLAGVPVFAWSLRAAAEVRGVVRVLLVVAEPDRTFAELAVADARPTVDVIVGGSSRHDSERLAVESLADDIESGSVDVVAVHDAARPLASPDLFATVIQTAHDRGGAIPVRPQPAVVAADDAGGCADALGAVVAVQTPQAFRATALLAAFRRAQARGFSGTDTASCVEEFTDLAVVGVPGSADNLKITFSDDLVVAERLLAARRAAAARAREGQLRR
jgi:2-C-methyl-D-erythritol 4-phosphate cytidylyltransferase